MKPKSSEIFIPGPAGRLEAKYYKNPKFGSPVAIVLHPHPQYGGTMNNRIVQLIYNIFLENGFYWNWNEVQYEEVPYGIESLDIDTEEDFEMARLLWENKQVKNKYIDY